MDCQAILRRHSALMNGIEAPRNQSTGATNVPYMLYVIPAIHRAIVTVGYILLTALEWFYSYGPYQNGTEANISNLVNNKNKRG